MLYVLFMGKVNKETAEIRDEWPIPGKGEGNGMTWIASISNGAFYVTNLKLHCLTALSI